MMNKNISKQFALGCLAMTLPFPGQALDTDMELSLKYSQQYMSQGQDLNDGDGAVHPELFIGFGDSGWYTGLWGAYASERRDEWREWDEWDLYVGYGTSLWTERTSQLDLDISYTYLEFFRANDNAADYHEVIISGQWPKAMMDGLITPYAALIIEKAVENASKDNIDNWLVRFGGNTAWQLGPEDQLIHTLNAYLETYYNAGDTSGTKSGFSHIALGVDAPFNLGSFSVTPALNYQISLEDTVNDENEFWFSLKIACSL